LFHVNGFDGLNSKQTNDNNQNLSIPEKQDISATAKNHGKTGETIDSR
jgi:hypothetical protein